MNAFNEYYNQSSSAAVAAAKLLVINNDKSTIVSTITIPTTTSTTSISAASVNDVYLGHKLVHWNNSLPVTSTDIIINQTTTAATGSGSGGSGAGATEHYHSTSHHTSTELPLFRVEFSKILSTVAASTTNSNNGPLLNDPTQPNHTHHLTTIVLEPDLRVHYPGLALLLSIICVIVVFGNGLTMLSICKERYLRTVTNYFVASLAFADCLVGAIVMPFSIVHEVMNKWWIFGQDWCDIWHSFDVLASTASILNLCVISLDRYWAITNPMTYPSRMTPRKAFIFILSLWLCSALISFPAIVWWRLVQKPIEPYRCFFTDDVGYLVFSSIISFYGPLTIMVFTYYRIYVVASEQNRSLKLGVKQIEMSFIGENHSMGKMATDTGTETTSPSSSLTNRKANNKNVNSKINVSNVDYRSGFALRMHRGGGGGSSSSAIITGAKSATNSRKRAEKESRFEMIKKKCSSFTNRRSDDDNRFTSISTAAFNKNALKRISEDSTSFDVDVDLDDKQQPHSHHKVTNWSVGRRLTKLAKERKAAKTLGIVMGVFILCWLPFFVTNILMGICPQTCILEPDLVFSIVTWLGWINSAMNPIIYACWSKDFRRAFRKLLCSCFMRNTSLSYNRNRIYKAQNTASRYNYNLYYKSRIKNRQQQQPIQDLFGDAPRCPSKRPHSPTINKQISTKLVNNNNNNNVAGSENKLSNESNNIDPVINHETTDDDDSNEPNNGKNEDNSNDKVIINKNQTITNVHVCSVQSSSIMKNENTTPDSSSIYLNDYKDEDALKSATEFYQPLIVNDSTKTIDHLNDVNNQNIVIKMEKNQINQNNMEKNGKYSKNFNMKKSLSFSLLNQNQQPSISPSFCSIINANIKTDDNKIRRLSIQTSSNNRPLNSNRKCLHQLNESEINGDDIGQKNFLSYCLALDNSIITTSSITSLSSAIFDTNTMSKTNNDLNEDDDSYSAGSYTVRLSDDNHNAQLAEDGSETDNDNNDGDAESSQKE